jgi:hypothetical protein
MTGANGRGSAAQPPLNAVDATVNGHLRGDSHNISPLSNGDELAAGRVVSLPAPFWARRMSRAAGLLRGRALNVYLIIASHSWSPGKPAWPSLATISEKTGIDRRHLPALIHQIEDAGLLRVHRRRGRGTVFEPVDDAELSPPEVTPLSPPKVTPLSPPEVTEQGRGTREKKRAPPGGGAARERAIPATHSTGALNGSSQGHHLPADWTPTAADAERARSRGLDPDEEAEAFRDHWHAETGPKALKRDWHAAYRTWCRHSAERRASDRGGARLTAAEERRRRGTEAIYRAAVARR